MEHDDRENIPRCCVPEPAHPHRRRKLLPHQVAKSETEDPDAPARVRAIMASPSYRIADEDTGFLRREDTRALRLHLDYLKPQVLFADHGIEHTIVVYGSTRIVEPAAAARRVQEAETALAAKPADAELQRELEIARRIEHKSRYYDIARTFGNLVGRAGRGPADCRVVLVTGGGPGIMEAANRGAFDAGAKTAGLDIDLPHEQFPNPYITPELCMRFHYFAMRKLHFLLRAKALIAFPGGYGTMDELFETLALVQTRKVSPVPVVLVGQEFWRGFCDIDFLVEEGTIDPEDRDLFWFAETAEEIWEGILTWHERSGSPLFGGC
jgi:uncharacterized protein (TIGR00730 family)